MKETRYTISSRIPCFRAFTFLHVAFENVHTDIKRSSSISIINVHRNGRHFSCSLEIPHVLHWQVEIGLESLIIEYEIQIRLELIKKDLPRRIIPNCIQLLHDLIVIG